jgi:hypothetical protein
MGDLQIRGGWKAERIARAFERAAAHDLRDELRRGLDDGARPIVDAAHRSALENLPKRKGLNLIVARARITVHHSSGRRLSIKILAEGIDQLYLIDKAGEVMHPTFGHRPRVIQPIPKAEGWFTEACQGKAHEMRRELERALDRVARRIGRSG